MAEKSIELFFSYAHEDETFKDELLKHLKVLQRQGIISAWHDRMIMPGDEWDHEIKNYLSAADIILLLVSPDFLDSDYCWGVEVQRAMARHEAGEACVIPVILRFARWSNTPFAKLQALPRNAKPIKSWADQDEAFDNVAEGIEIAVRQLQEQRRSRLKLARVREAQAVLRHHASGFAFPGTAFFVSQAVEKQKMGDIRGAIRSYSQAIDLNPDDADTYYNRGLNHIMINNWVSARDDFQTAAMLYVQYGNIHRYQDCLARLKELQG